VVGPCTLYELRQYTLHPGRRDVLIDLFDREFVETQEEVGMRVLGQFRDLGDPDRFVWIRGFADLRARREGLTAFYGGPVWAAHRDAANATMRDSDDVLLLRPVPGRDFRLPAGRRPGPGAGAGPASTYVAYVHRLEEPLEPEAVRDVGDRLSRAVERSGGESVAVLETAPVRNDFPALPVREGEHVLVHVTRSSGGGPGTIPDLGAARLGPPIELRLAPTARSLLG
jgi:hypothetical protein